MYFLTQSNTSEFILKVRGIFCVGTPLTFSDIFTSRQPTCRKRMPFCSCQTHVQLQVTFTGKHELHERELNECEIRNSRPEQDVHVQDVLLPRLASTETGTTCNQNFTLSTSYKTSPQDFKTTGLMITCRIFVLIKTRT